MKRNVFLIVFMLAGIFSYGQAVRGRTVSINALSYPTEPLKYKNFTVRVDGIGIIEEFGVTMNDVENIFQQTQHLVYTRNNDYNYILMLVFENPSFSGITTKEKKSGNSVQYYGVAVCNVPVHKALLSPGGLEIYEKELVSKSINIESSTYPTAEAAKKDLEGYLKKNRNSEIAKSIKNALIEIRNDFQSKHDLYTYPKPMDFTTIKPSKKYTEQGWENNYIKISELSKVMAPGQTLVDYKADITPMIQFYDDQLALITKKDNKSNIMRWGAVQNITNLYILMADFDKLPKYHEIVKDHKLLRAVLAQQNNYAKAYNARKEIYLSGVTVDEERLALAKLKYDADSLQNKPSKVTIFFKDNRVFNGIAYVNEYRPNYIEPAKGNIIELTRGRFLKVVPENKENKEKEEEEENYTLVNANEINKVIAGDEVFLPVLIGNQNNPVYAYLIHQTPKIKVLSYRKDYLLHKNSDQSAEIVSPSLLGSMHKKVADFLVDCPELSKKISSKEIELKNVNDLIKIADLYTSY